MRKLTFLVLFFGSLVLLGPGLAGASTSYTFLDTTTVQGWQGHAPSGLYDNVDIVADPPTSAWDIKQVTVTYTDDNKIVMQIYTNYPQAGLGPGQADIALNLYDGNGFTAAIIMQPGADFGKLVTGVDWGAVPENLYSSPSYINYAGRYYVDGQPTGIPLTLANSWQDVLGMATVDYGAAGTGDGISTYLLTVTFDNPGVTPGKNGFGFEVSSGSCANDTMVVPIPGSVLLLGSGILGMLGLGWRRRGH
jgi:hypothetical protein